MTVHVDNTLVGVVHYVYEETMYEFRDLKVRGSVVTLKGGKSFVSLAEVEIFTRGKIFGLF